MQFPVDLSGKSHVEQTPLMSNWLLDVDGNFLPETGEELGIRKCSHGKITVSTIGLEGYPLLWTIYH